MCVWGGERERDCQSKLLSEIKSLRRQYWRYFDSLITNESSDQPYVKKKFWTYIKQNKNENASISPLKVDGRPEVKDKAEGLNQKFHSAFSSKESFSKEEFRSRCPMSPVDPLQLQCKMVEIAMPGVWKLLEKKLDPSKASGPDGISP